MISQFFPLLSSPKSSHPLYPNSQIKPNKLEVKDVFDSQNSRYLTNMIGQSCNCN